MESNFEKCLNEVLKHEGGYSDHPSDPGGATNRGVTKKAWEEYVGHEVTKDDIKALTVEQVTPVCRCDELHAGLDYVIFDIAVNSGTGRAAKFLQSAIGVAADGAIGPRTIAALGSSALTPKELIGIICDRRELFWRSLPTFGTFGRGWLSRGDGVRKKALETAA